MNCSFDFSRLSILSLSFSDPEGSNLERGFRWAGLDDVVHVTSLDDALKALESRFFDVVFVDGYIRDVDVYRFLDVVKTTFGASAAATRFILYAEKPSGMRVLEAMKHGFSSVLAAPAASEDILRHIAYALTRFEPSTVMPAKDQRPLLDSLFESPRQVIGEPAAPSLNVGNYLN